MSPPMLPPKRRFQFSIGMVGVIVGGVVIVVGALTGNAQAIGGGVLIAFFSLVFG